MKKRLFALALLPVLAMTFTGCSTSADGTQAIHIVKSQRGTTFPQSDNSSSSYGPAAFWTDGKRSTVDLLTYGSSSCPVIPASIKVISATEVELTAKEYKGACTADLGAHTTRFVMPQTVSRSSKVKITLSTHPTDPASMDTDFILPVSPTIAQHPKYIAPSPEATASVQ